MWSSKGNEGQGCKERMEIQGKGLSGSGAAGMYALCVLIWVRSLGKFDFGFVGIRALRMLFEACWLFKGFDKQRLMGFRHHPD